MTHAINDREVKLDRMRYVKNVASSRLCYLAILLNVLYFVSIYKSDVGNWYYQILIGGSIVYNLLFMLTAFLASEGVKNYQTSYCKLLFILGALQVLINSSSSTHHSKKLLRMIRFPSRVLSFTLNVALYQARNKRTSTAVIISSGFLTWLKNRRRR